jgi:hypothetical protein
MESVSHTSTKGSGLSFEHDENQIEQNLSNVKFLLPFQRGFAVAR